MPVLEPGLIKIFQSVVPDFSAYGKLERGLEFLHGIRQQCARRSAGHNQIGLKSARNKPSKKFGALYPDWLVSSVAGQ